MNDIIFFPIFYWCYTFGQFGEGNRIFIQNHILGEFHYHHRVLEIYIFIIIYIVNLYRVFHLNGIIRINISAAAESGFFRLLPCSRCRSCDIGNTIIHIKIHEKLICSGYRKLSDFTIAVWIRALSGICSGKIHGNGSRVFFRFLKTHDGIKLGKSHSAGMFCFSKTCVNGNSAFIQHLFNIISNGYRYGSSIRIRFFQINIVVL